MNIDSNQNPFFAIHDKNVRSTARVLHLNGQPIHVEPLKFTQNEVNALNPQGNHRGIVNGRYIDADGQNGTKHELNSTIAIARTAERFVHQTLKGNGLSVSQPNFGWDHRREADMNIITPFGYIDVEVKSIQAQFATERGYVFQASRPGRKEHKNKPWVNPLLRKGTRRGGNELVFCVKVNICKKNGNTIYICEPDVVFGAFARDLIWSDPNDSGRLGLKMTVRSDQNRSGTIPVVNLVHTHRITTEQRPHIINFRDMETPFELKMMLNNDLRGISRQRGNQYHFTTNLEDFFNHVGPQYQKRFPFNQSKVRLSQTRVKQKQNKRCMRTMTKARSYSGQPKHHTTKIHKPVVNAWATPPPFIPQKSTNSRVVYNNRLNATSA